MVSEASKDVIPFSQFSVNFSCGKYVNFVSAKFSGINTSHWFNVSLFVPYVYCSGLNVLSVNLYSYFHS